MLKDVLKARMIKDKSFLKDLYEGTNFERKKRILNSSSDSKLDTLLNFLHFLVNGEICMKKEHFDLIPINRLKFLVD